jgi:hypothetical protein
VLRTIVLIASVLVLTDVISDGKSLRLAVGLRGGRGIVPFAFPGWRRTRYDPIPAAEADRVAVGVGEHADPHLGRDLTWGAALGRTGREEARAGRVEILDVGVGHGPAGRVVGSQADLEAVDVVPDVIRLIHMGRIEQRRVDGLCRLHV